MKIRVIASTKPGYQLDKADALDFSGKSAGICYMSSSIDELFSEDSEKTEKRVKRTLESGHHSVYGHVTYNLVLEGIPKILAMILNNEKIYNTSEKSARYTQMECSGKEKELYDKWIEIFSMCISQEYPRFTKNIVKKYAQENARYLISIFNPSTTMEYTVSLQQLNYIIYWAQEYIKNTHDDKFTIKVKEVLKQFLEELPDIKVDGLDSSMKNRGFSLFSSRFVRYEEFGENYSISYYASFSQLGQALRHRTISYEMTFLDDNTFYIPPIIRNTDLEEQWLEDMASLSDLFPQGMQVLVNERGTIENFALKCTERLCGAAQLEIMQQTQETLSLYLEYTKKLPELQHYLLQYSGGPRCTFKNFKCKSPCIFGCKEVMKRLI